MDDFSEYIKNNLIVKDIIKKRGMTIRELSEAVGFGAPQQMTNLLAGKAVSLRSLKKIAEVLGVGIGDLFSRTEVKEHQREERPKDGYFCPTCGARLSIKKHKEIQKGDD